MANTPNNAIPLVPQNTLDPASGLNLALDVLDALTQIAVTSMTVVTPPASPADGARYIVPASGATGVWVGHANQLARYVLTGAFWQYYPSPRVLFDLATLCLYSWNGTTYTRNNGSQILATVGAPAVGVGNNGDYAWDAAAKTMYGPKAAGAWPAGVVLSGTNGTNGNTILSTTGAPASGTGNNGDFAIDTAAGLIYGPKAAGAWPAGVSIVGPTGATGATGNSISRPLGTLTAVAGVVNIDLTAGEVFDLTPTAAITGWTVSNPPAAGHVAEVRIRLKMGATAYAVASPAVGKTAGGAWVASSAANAMEWLSLEIDNTGAITGMVAMGVMA